MTRLDKYQAIIIDDIGYVKKTDAETHVLFEFIAHRYESGSLIITANQPFSAWDKMILAWPEKRLREKIWEKEKSGKYLSKLCPAPTTPIILTFPFSESV